jgi:hypothetical protein
MAGVRLKCRMPGCSNTVRAAETRTGFCRNCLLNPPAAAPASPSLAPVAPTASQRVDTDRTTHRLQEDLADLRMKYAHALETIEQQDAEMEVFRHLESGRDDTICIEPRESSGTSEAVPVILASDWHAEEIVTKAQVNGLNEFNEKIAHQRVTRFFQASVNLIKNHLNPGVKIHHVVVGLLGDFITNDIHEELVENVWCRPTEAITWVQNRIVAGIDFFLNHTPYTYTFVCKVGNHARTTKKTHFSQENGHSLEHLLYVFLDAYYRNEPRVSFQFSGGYLSYLDIYSTTVRFHHGHAIKYNGGVGGLTIPCNKAVAQWDKGHVANLDCFGHFHQTKSDQKWKCNGSLIGYNSFGVAIKGDFEPPKQTLFLIDKKRGVTCDWPILLQ